MDDEIIEWQDGELKLDEDGNFSLTFKVNSHGNEVNQADLLLLCLDFLGNLAEEEGLDLDELLSGQKSISSRILN